MKETIHSEHKDMGGNGTYKWVLEKNLKTGRESVTYASVQEELVGCYG